MTRRGGFEIKYIALVGGGLFFLFGFYSYHNASNKLKVTEDLLEQSRAQHDSVAAQLEVVYEHKNRIQANLDKEKLERQKRDTEFEQERSKLFDKCSEEKNDLQKTIDGVNQQKKMWQSQNEDLQEKLTRCEGELNKANNDKDALADENQKEYQQFKQEVEFELVKLRDEKANLEKNMKSLQSQLWDAQNRLKNAPQVPMNQVNQQFQPVAGGQQFQQAQQQQQYQQGAIEQPQQPVFQRSNDQFNQQPQQQQAIVQNNLQQQQGIVQNDFQQQQQGVQQNGQQVIQHLQKSGLAPQDNGAMQINKPEQKPYYEPKLPNGNIAQVKLPAPAADDNDEGGKVVQEQVAAPHMNQNDEALNNDQPDQPAGNNNDRPDILKSNNANNDHLQEQVDDRGNGQDDADQNDAPDEQRNVPDQGKNNKQGDDNVDNYEDEDENKPGMNEDYNNNNNEEGNNEGNLFDKKADANQNDDYGGNAAMEKEDEM